MRLGSLGRRLAAALLVASVVPLAILFAGTVAAHLVQEPDPSHDAVSEGWLFGAVVLAVAAALGLSLRLARRLVRPLDGYIGLVRAFAAGDRSARPAGDILPEFADLTGALIAAADAVEHSEAARRRLTADIAHELRTPLAALQAGLEELRDGYVAPDPAILGALHEQARRMSRILNDLAQLAAAETALQHDPRPCDLGEEVRLAVAAWQGSLSGAGLALRTAVDDGVVVRADPDRIHQMVGNLLANAALYCAPGDSVAVAVHRAGSMGAIVVADTGPGIDPPDLPYVFDRAWRSARSADIPGSGLGLPIVRALAVAQHGTVRVSVTPGGGTTITVELPIAAPQDAGRDPSRPATAGSA